MAASGADGGVVNSILASLQRISDVKKRELDDEFAKFVGQFRSEFETRGVALLNAAIADGHGGRNPSQRNKFVTCDPASFQDARLQRDRAIAAGAAAAAGSDSPSSVGSQGRKRKSGDCNEATATDAELGHLEKRNRLSDVPPPPGGWATAEDFIAECTKKTVKQLQAVLKRRKVDISGLRRKDPLVRRYAELLADDENERRREKMEAAAAAPESAPSQTPPPAHMADAGSRAPTPASAGDPQPKPAPTQEPDGPVTPKGEPEGFAAATFTGSASGRKGTPPMAAATLPLPPRRAGSLLDENPRQYSQSISAGMNLSQTLSPFSQTQPMSQTQPSGDHDDDEDDDNGVSEKVDSHSFAGSDDEPQTPTSERMSSRKSSLEKDDDSAQGEEAKRRKISYTPDKPATGSADTWTRDEDQGEELLAEASKDVVVAEEAPAPAVDPAELEEAQRRERILEDMRQREDRSRKHLEEKAKLLEQATAARSSPASSMPAPSEATSVSHNTLPPAPVPTTAAARALSVTTSVTSPILDKRPEDIGKRKSSPARVSNISRKSSFIKDEGDYQTALRNEMEARMSRMSEGLTPEILQLSGEMRRAFKNAVLQKMESKALEGSGSAPASRSSMQSTGSAPAPLRSSASPPRASPAEVRAAPAAPDTDAPTTAQKAGSSAVAAATAASAPAVPAPVSALRNKLFHPASSPSLLPPKRSSTATSAKPLEQGSVGRSIGRASTDDDLRPGSRSSSVRSMLSQGFRTLNPRKPMMPVFKQAPAKANAGADRQTSTSSSTSITAGVARPATATGASGTGDSRGQRPRVTRPDGRPVGDYKANTLPAPPPRPLHAAAGKPHGPNTGSGSGAPVKYGTMRLGSSNSSATASPRSARSALNKSKINPMPLNAAGPGKPLVPGHGSRPNSATREAAPQAMAPAKSISSQPLAPRDENRANHANEESKTNAEAAPANSLSQPSAASAQSGETAAIPVADEVGPWREQDNYEISEHEESDEDESDSDDSRPPKKPVPEWAQKANLMKALQAQYFGEHRPDPDDIFGAIPACDLEAIFKNSKKRYKQRGSSGMWHFDGLTLKEKRQYRKDVGLE